MKIQLFNLAAHLGFHNFNGQNGVNYVSQNSHFRGGCGPKIHKLCDSFDNDKISHSVP